MRPWMKYSIYITSLILVALILLPSLAVGKPPEDKDKDNGKPPKTKDEVKFVTITSSSGSHGNVSPSGAVKVKIGDDQRFKIKANGGYRIEEVLVDDNPDPDFENKKEENKHIREWEHLFKNVKESCRIHATFERDVFTIKALAKGPGTISPPGAVKVRSGDSQKFTIKATQGFCIEDVQISPSDDSNTLDMDEAKGAGTYTFSFDGVTSDYTIIITFARLKEPEPDPEADPVPLTIESEAGDGGSIDPSGEVEVEYGSDQTFTIKPEAPCNRISVVKVDGVPVDVSIDEDTGEGTYTFSNVTSKHTIIAKFEKITYIITATSDKGGSIEPSGGVEVACGSEQTFTITPGLCHRIAVVEVDNVPVDVNIDEDTGARTYTFSNVKLGHTIHATFEEITYTITATAGDGGSIDPSGEMEVVCGSEQTFTITPGPCYSIAEVLVGNSPVAVAVDIDAGTGIGTYTFTGLSSGDTTIHATFAEGTEPNTIRATSDEFGSIKPSGEVEVACGSEQIFTITPDEPCYGIAVVEVDGVPVNVGIDEATGEVTYTFTNVASDHTINATFEKITHTITASAEGGGSIDPSGGVKVECGGSQLFKIKPDEGYTRGSVLVDGIPVKTKGNKYEFTDVDSDHTIEVKFVEDLDEDDPKGDVNNDGKVNSGDAIFILLIVTGQIEPTEQQKLAADVNGDGVIDINDALFVLNIVAGLSAPGANVDNALLQNFPNPFNPETWIPFSLSKGSEVTIEIYDATGHLLRRLPLGHKPAGFYTSRERAAYWDGCNENGERVASGIYFYAIRAADFTDMRKMIIAQ